MTIAENLSKVHQNILLACKKSNRDPSTVKLVAVTKTANASETIEAINAGATAVGENRIHIAQEKFPHLPEVEKHMIGHLQTNKAKSAVELFDVIQSVDSLKLAKEIDKRAKDAGKVMKIMIQVNVSGEEQKFGIPADEAAGFYNKLTAFLNIKVIGIMTMAPFVEPEETRHFFKKTKELAEGLNLKEISMGMTNDYMIAIEEGSTMVRIGRAIFNPA